MGDFILRFDVSNIIIKNGKTLYVKFIKSLSTWISLNGSLPSTEVSLKPREAGEVVGGERKTSVGQWEGRREEDRLPPFPLSMALCAQQWWLGGMSWFPYKSF